MDYLPGIQDIYCSLGTVAVSIFLVMFIFSLENIYDNIRTLTKRAHSDAFYMKTDLEVVNIYFDKTRDIRLKVVCACEGGRNANFFVRCTTRHLQENSLKISA